MMRPFHGSGWHGWHTLTTRYVTRGARSMISGRTTSWRPTVLQRATTETARKAVENGTGPGNLLKLALVASPQWQRADTRSVNRSPTAPMPYGQRDGGQGHGICDRPTADGPAAVGHPLGPSDLASFAAVIHSLTTRVAQLRHQFFCCWEAFPSTLGSFLQWQSSTSLRPRGRSAGVKEPDH